MAQDFKRGVSPKAQKRMAEFKPAKRQKPSPRPPHVLEGELDEAAFGKLVKRNNPKVEDEK